MNNKRNHIQSRYIIIAILFFQNMIGNAQKSEPQMRPPLGWNSFDSYGIYLNEKNATANIEEMAGRYLPFGYEYFVIDAGWYFENEVLQGSNYPVKESSPALDQYGVYEPSKTYFQGGIKPLADKAHQMGLKFGLHLMRGIPKKAVKLNLPVKGTNWRASQIADTLNVCSWSSLTYGVDMTKPGSQEWYNSIFEKFADWGIDFVKVDDMTPYPDEILALEKAVQHCGRPIIISLSPGDVTDQLHVPFYRTANSVRVTGDIWDRSSDINRSFIAWKKFQGLATDGFWIDLDMIPFGQLNLEIPKQYEEERTTENRNFNHWCRLTKDQMKTFITMRALACSPLFIGGDLISMDDFSYSLITNKHMLQCNQNGVMATSIYENDSIEIWHAREKSDPHKGWIGIFNRSTQDKSKSFTKMDLGLRQFFRSTQTIEYPGDIQIHDIWNQKDIIMKNQLTISIQSEGVVFLEFSTGKNHSATTSGQRQ